jgi:hypothetical protein
MKYLLILLMLANNLLAGDRIAVDWKQVELNLDEADTWTTVSVVFPKDRGRKSYSSGWYNCYIYTDTSHTTVSASEGDTDSLMIFVAPLSPDSNFVVWDRIQWLTPYGGLQGLNFDLRRQYQFPVYLDATKAYRMYIRRRANPGELYVKVELSF